MDNSAVILETLQRLERKVDALLAKKPRKSRRAVEDNDALLAKMLPIIAAGIGEDGRNFKVSEALTFIQANDAALFAHIHRVLGSEGGDVPKRLGNVLRSAVGRQIAGLTIHRLGKDDNRVLWQTRLVVSGAQLTHQTNLAA